MNKVLVDIRNESEWIQQYFTSDLVTIDNLLDVIDNLHNEVESLKEKIEDMRTPNEPDEYDIWRENGHS